MKTIADYAFYRCTNLFNVSLGNGVTSIGSGAFNNCAVRYTTYNNATYLGNSTNKYVALIKATSTAITSCMIHPNTKLICRVAFLNCTKLTSIVIPEGVTSIRGDAFFRSSLKSVTIPNNVTSIGGDAFRECTALTSVTIPDSVTSIGGSAFKDCGKLTTVYYKGTSSQWDTISISTTNNSDLTNATRYYYSETSASGCWRYVDGVPTKW